MYIILEEKSRFQETDDTGYEKIYSKRFIYLKIQGFMIDVKCDTFKSGWIKQTTVSSVLCYKRIISTRLIISLTNGVL